MPGPDPFAPAKLGPISLRNRIVKAATFEGMTPEHVVSDRTAEEGLCVHCNKCMPTIYRGTHCVLAH